MTQRHLVLTIEFRMQRIADAGPFLAGGAAWRLALMVDRRGLDKQILVTQVEFDPRVGVHPTGQALPRTRSGSSAL